MWIGYLSPVIAHNPVDDAFEWSLEELGWILDRNIKIEYRYTGGRQDTIAPVVAEVASLGLELHVVWGQLLALPLMRASPNIALVFLVTGLIR
jgi:hypothetical protein